MKNKKGISPLIATVLIIGFTIVLSALVITWGTGLFKKTVSSTEELSEFNLKCTSTDYKGTAKYVSASGEVQVTLVNNNQQDLYGFQFTTRGKPGTTDESDTPMLYITDTAVATLPEVLDNQMTPAGTGASTRGLTPFAKRTYRLVGIDLATEARDLVDVRAIMQLSSGTKKVCDNSQEITVA